MNMNKPVLVVMAAGMGSRYGGLKQLDPVDAAGQFIIDYSVFDAHRAGFDTVVFVIKREHEADFHRTIGDRISSKMNVLYVFQDKEDLPEGYAVPQERVKPWGTAHAVLAARDVVDGPFAVINADDFYGPNAFAAIYDYLSKTPDSREHYEYAMVGYRLENTLTEHGTVARGVCQVSPDGYLRSVTERTKIEKGERCPRYTEDGQTWVDVPGDAIVSLNVWGFTRSYMDEALARFPAFLDKVLAENPLKGEYFLPSVVSQLVSQNKARVKVLPCGDRWYGVTYREDKPVVMAALQAMIDDGIYPAALWKENT